MSKQNASSLLEKPHMRLTRARTRALGHSGGFPPLHPMAKHDDRGLHRSNFKRAASDENKPPISTTDCLHKKRAVLKDVTNVICESSYLYCINASNVQSSNFQSKLNKHEKESLKGTAKVAPAVLHDKPQVQEERKETINEKKKLKAEEEVNLAELSKENLSIQSTILIRTTDCFVPHNILVKKNNSKHVQLQTPSKIEEKKPSEKYECSGRLGVIDIDSKHKDPLMCAVYAPAIYENMNATELDRRPSVDYMVKLQRDITKGMRSILIDWLVEVSEEYRLVPDTVYLTVNLIDRFLSGNYVEKKKLQLLGITCMLIASKYEEICAPSVKEFCFITDNAYTKEEVIKSESRVVNFLGFQLSVPTSKKFLRRFIQAAQILYKVPSVELEFLANYLGELTLLEYSFLKFLPSLIAASAVFLARWILDQEDHPWNSTLEHYTGYNSMGLEKTVVALQELQLNTRGSSLNIIRKKYKQEKFKRVATLSASKPVQSLFYEPPGSGV